jgi:predicted phosphodiesterase
LKDRKRSAAKPAIARLCGAISREGGWSKRGLRNTGLREHPEQFIHQFPASRRTGIFIVRLESKRHIVRSMRIAVIADIHGNSLALEAVLAHLRTQVVDSIVDLGDCVSGPLWPRETMDRLETLRLPTVRGNHDRVLGTVSPEAMGPSDRYAHQGLTQDQCKALGALPTRLDLDQGIVCFHAGPDSDLAYTTDEIAGGRLVRASRDAASERFRNVAARIILVGHSHRPDMLQLTSGALLINPGSVGLPAYDDDGVAPHVSESATPHARYAILDDDGSMLPNVTFHAVSYDFDAASRRATANNRPDWAIALRTGFMR